jgi:hypothetical protein
MNRKIRAKRILLAGASALAMIAAASEAGATTFLFTGSEVTYTVPTSGTYDIAAFGAQGGPGIATVGGLGAAAGGNVSLSFGTVLTVLAGGAGASGDFGGGNAGSSYAAANGRPGLRFTTGGLGTGEDAGEPGVPGLGGRGAPAGGGRGSGVLGGGTSGGYSTAALARRASHLLASLTRPAGLAAAAAAASRAAAAAAARISSRCSPVRFSCRASTAAMAL